MTDITIWNAELYFKNFSGDPGRFNNAGDRNFGVFIDDKTAADLEADGWNVKRAKPDDTGYQRPYLKVKVNFKGKPKIYLVTNGNKQFLDEDTVDLLDRYTFEKIDIKIRHAYLKNYDVYTNYLDKGFFTLLEDDLDRAYFGEPADDEDVSFI